jgi:hypothetical protein
MEVIPEVNNRGMWSDDSGVQEGKKWVSRRGLSKGHSPSREMN